MTEENKIIKPTDADVHEELGKVIEEITDKIEDNGRGNLKASPLLRLYDRDQLNVDYIMEEYPKVMNRTSNHSSNMRRTIVNVMNFALQRLAVKVFQKINENNKPTLSADGKPVGTITNMKIESNGQEQTN